MIFSLHQLLSASNHFGLIDYNKDLSLRKYKLNTMKTSFNNLMAYIFLLSFLLFSNCSGSDDVGSNDNNNSSGSNDNNNNVDTRYTIPPADNDGWIVGDINLSDTKKSRLMDGIDRIEQKAYGEIHSILFVRNKELVFEKYFPGTNSQGQFINFDRFTKHEVQSASKSYRSLLIGIAIDKGYINGVEEKVFDFFPEHQNLLTSEKEDITLDHFLNMASGLDWNEGSSPNTLSQMYALPPNQWLEFLLSRDIEHTPGTTFDYNTGASIALNNIVIKSINTSFTTFLRDNYSNLIESQELPGVGYPLGGETTPRDMAKFGHLFMYNGKWKNTQVISESWVSESLTPKLQVNNALNYGYQWWHRTMNYRGVPYDVNYANGNGGQFVIIIKDLDLIIVSTGGKFGTSGYEIFNFMNDYVFPAFTD